LTGHANPIDGSVAIRAYLCTGGAGRAGCSIEPLKCEASPPEVLKLFES
jgi:hypothetical protein